MLNIKSTRFAIVLALGLAAATATVSLQGWRSRLLGSDLWIAEKSAEAFLATGRIPDHGCLSSLRSYIPPGSNIFMIPGVMLFNDQRLYELSGAALLHLGTIVGLFLLCRLYFSMRCAYVSVVLYAVSALGLLFATSLWPRGHPFFAVWFFYFLGDWSIRDRRGALGWALFTWAIGMYYFIELAPLLVAVPITYCVRLPRISKSAVAFSIIASLLVWSPYILFESQRDYRDLASLISRHPLRVWDPTAARGPYRLLEARTDQPLLVQVPSGGALQTAVVKAAGGIDALLSNFSANVVFPGVAGALLALCVAGLALAVPQVWGWLSSRLWGPGLAVAFGAAGLACLNAATLVRVALHRALPPRMAAYTFRMGSNLLVFILAILAIAWFQHAQKKTTARASADTGRQDVLLFALCFSVAWGTIAMLVPSVMNGRRLWWAWPIHIAFIALFLCSLSRRIAVPLTLTVFGVLAGNHTMVDRLRDWQSNGWSGKDPAVLQLLDTVASLKGSSEKFVGGFGLGQLAK